MSRRLGEESAAAVYALAVCVAVLAPALVLARTASGGGAGRMAWPADVLVVSALIGGGYAVAAHRRLRRRVRHAGSTTNTWIAALDALVVLALCCTGILTVILHELGGLRADVGNVRGAVVVLWGVLLLVAVVVTEVADRALFRWLSAAGPPSPAGARQARGAATERLQDNRASRGG